MFGYVNADINQLSEEDKTKYRMFYCGLCHQLGQRAGLKGQLLLNYDLCFLAILLQSLYEPELTSGKQRCIIHPIKLKNYYASDAIEYAADMDIILSYHSLMDNYADDNSRLSLAAATALKTSYLSVKDKYPRQTDAVENYISQLPLAEASRETNLDKVSSYTGEMLGTLLNWKEDSWGKTLHCMGFHLGKFIYIIDAYEDLKKDEKKGSYNPLSFMKAESPKEYETFVRVNLTSLMAECAKGFERLPIVENADILRNIIYSGVWSKYEYLQIKNKDIKENHK